MKKEEVDIVKLIKIQSAISKPSLKAVERVVLALVICSPVSTNQILHLLPKDSERSVRTAISSLRKEGFIFLTNGGHAKDASDRNKWKVNILTPEKP